MELLVRPENEYLFPQRIGMICKPFTAGENGRDRAYFLKAKREAKLLKCSCGAERFDLKNPPAPAG